MNEIQSKKILEEKIMDIPIYAIMCSLIIFLFMSLSFFSIDFIIDAPGISYHDVKIPAIDNLIPYEPIMYIPYGLSYPFWIIGMMVVAKTGKEHYINFVIAVLVAYLIGFLILIIFPTELNRVAEGTFHSRVNGIWDHVANIFYANDGKTVGRKLFPSFHCLSSTMCYLGVMEKKEISVKYRVFALISTVIICLSTLYCKQHYFIDVPGGVLLGTACYVMCVKLNPGKRILKGSSRISENA